MSNLVLVDGPAGETAAGSLDRPSGAEALDAYSTVITTVARDLAASVANLRVYFAGSVTAGVVSALGRSLPVRSGSAQRVVDNVIVCRPRTSSSRRRAWRYAASRTCTGS